MVDNTVLVVIAFVVSIAVEAAIGTVVGLVIKSKFEKREQEKKEAKENADRLAKIEKEKEAAESNARCELVKQAIHEEMESMKNNIKEELEPLKENVDQLRKGFQKDLRRSLRQDGALYLTRGYASHQEKTEYDELYWTYHNMGRNGVVDAEHNRVMELPDHPEGAQHDANRN